MGRDFLVPVDESEVRHSLQGPRTQPLTVLPSALPYFQADCTQSQRSLLQGTLRALEWTLENLVRKGAQQGTAVCLTVH